MTADQGERKALVERLRRYADIFSAAPPVADPVVTEWGALTVDALRKAANLLESDARAAAWRAEAEGSLVEAGKALGYMSERADRAEAAVRDARQLLITLQFARPAGTKDPVWEELSAFLAGQRLSRPQETDAVLAEREACAKIAETAKGGFTAVLDPPDDKQEWGVIDPDGPWVLGSTIAAAIRSRPSPGPATAQPWDKRDRTLDPDDIADCYQRSPPAAPAAPSPDLAKATDAWAVVDADGSLDPRNVSNTRRAAIINWLVTARGMMFVNGDGDELIEQMWSARKGDASVVNVLVSATPPKGDAQ